MASRCQRSILSCSRCRKRKMKCDRQLPSCSQCVAAKSTCTGISANSAADVPRSIVQHLESEIARLEMGLIQAGILDMDVVHASDILLQMPSTLPALDEQDAGAESNDLGPDPVFSGPGNRHLDEEAGESLREPAGHQPAENFGSSRESRSRALRTSILLGKPLRAIVSATLPDGFSAVDLLSRVRMGMTPSAAQVSDRGRPTAVPSISGSKANRAGNGHGTLLSADVLRGIPADIVQRLMNKYMNTIQRDNPFLVESTVAQQFQNVADILEWQTQQQHQQQPLGSNSAPIPAILEPMPVLADHDFLVVYLVLAIAVTLGSANNGQEERRKALSMSLFEEGIQHFYNLKSFPSDIAWLQTILLVLLYATVFPRSANVWVLSGAAMRASLELGLHREPPNGSMDGLSHEALDLRRRVFWAAYCMDRSICSALQRPLSIPDAAINTKLPALLGDDDTFLGSITYHKLLSEMLHVHFQHEPVPQNLTWDDWLSGMESRLRAWYKLYGSSAELSSSSLGSLSHHHEMIEFNMARGLMILHRPSPRIPAPSSRSLLIAFEAASAAARIHHEHIRAGFFRRPWLSAHHTLEAATVVLYCLRHGSKAITERFTAGHVFEMCKLLTSNLLSIAAQGWPEVSVYASVYERLLAPLLERVFLRRSDLSDAFGPAQDAELMRLLYPGPAHLEKLRFGWREQVHEWGPFDFNLFMTG